MREAAPLLLVVAPTHLMVQAALKAHGIATDGGFLVRTVTRATGLRGWIRCIPVVAAEIDRWPVLAGREGEDLRDALLVMLAQGRLRLAQEADLARFREEHAA